MTLKNPAGRRRSLALIVATVALGGALTACSGAGGTTCGDFNELDEAGQRQLMADLITESDDDTAKEALEDAGDDSDALLDQLITDLDIAGQCEGNDDTEVGDIVYEEE